MWSNSMVKNCSLESSWIACLWGCALAATSSVDDRGTAVCFCVQHWRDRGAVFVQAIAEVLERGASPQAVKQALCSVLSLSPDQVNYVTY